MGLHKHEMHQEAGEWGSELRTYHSDGEHSCITLRQRRGEGVHPEAAVLPWLRQ